MSDLNKNIQELDVVTIRFAGDSGDGMQLTGNQFSDNTALFGNDLSTSHPEFNFPGLNPGDRWCLCAQRWKEAYEQGKAPPVFLESSHENTLKIVDFNILQRYAVN